jgi:hypothetical protein
VRGEVSPSDDELVEFMHGKADAMVLMHDALARAKAGAR